MTRGKRQTITLSLREGRAQTVPAVVYGPLAVHRNVDKPERYNVTHVRTGRTVLPRLRLRAARRAIQLLLDAPIRLDVASVDEYGPEERAAAVGVVRSVYQQVVN